MFSTDLFTVQMLLWKFEQYLSPLLFSPYRLYTQLLQDTIWINPQSLHLNASRWRRILIVTMETVPMYDWTATLCGFSRCRWKCLKSGEGLQILLLRLFATTTRMRQLRIFVSGCGEDSGGAPRQWSLMEFRCSTWLNRIVKFNVTWSEQFETISALRWRRRSQEDKAKVVGRRPPSSNDRATF